MAHIANIDALKAHADLPAIASTYTTLKKKGGRHWGRCFTGETEFLTDDGVKQLGDCAGTTQRVLTSNGRWVEAPIRSFGTQPVLRVRLTRNGTEKQIHATAEHEWFVQPGTSNTDRKLVRTDELRPGDRLVSQLPPPAITHDQVLPQNPGIKRGFAHGNSTATRPGSNAHSYGANDAALVPHPTGHELHGHDDRQVAGSCPQFWKTEFPLLEEAPEYLFGWLAGYFAANGSVSEQAHTVLESADRKALEFVERLCLRLGIGTYPIKEGARDVTLPEGRTIEGHVLYRMQFMNSTLVPEFFLIAEHRARHEAYEARRNQKDPISWTVDAVEQTDRVEEVFCAVVPDVENFVLADYILVHNCPYHEERSASFSIGGPGGDGVYYCFGCGAKGDTFKFVQDIEGLSFVEAVERVAALSGFTLDYEQQSGEQAKRAGLRSRIAAANAEAAVLYQTLLSGDDEGAARARHYLLEARGFTDTTLERFGIGWAPAAPDTIRTHLRSKGYDDELLLAAGLIRKTAKGRIMDAFRQRVIFPIHDSTHTKVIAFAGRVLDEDAEDPFGGTVPKYINTAETELYKKTDVLYGFGLARKSIVSANTAIIVEGYTDVMACQQAGVFNVVAACGTAIGSSHMSQIGRVVEDVVAMTDSDPAGRKAAVRTWKEAQKAGVSVRVAVLPDGNDPADVASGGAAAIHALMDATIDGYAFAVEEAWVAHDTSDPRGRTKALHTAVALLADIADPIERIAQIDFLARRSGFDTAAVTAAAAKASIDLATTTPSTRPVGAGEVASERRRRIEAQVLWLALTRPDLLPDTWSTVTVDDFQAEPAKACFTATATAGPDASMDQVMAAAANDDTRRVLGRVVAADPPDPLTADTATRLVNALVAPRTKARSTQIRQELAGAANDHDRAMQLLTEQQQLLGR